MPASMTPPERVYLYMNGAKRWYVSRPEHVTYRVEKERRGLGRYGRLWLLEPGQPWVELDPKDFLK